MVFGPMEKDVLYTTMIMTFTVGVDLGFVLGCFLLIFYHIASMNQINPHGKRHNHSRKYF